MCTDALSRSRCEPNAEWLWRSAQQFFILRVQVSPRSHQLGSWGFKSLLAVISWDLGGSSPSAVISWEQFNATREPWPQQQPNKNTIRHETQSHDAGEWGSAVRAAGYEPVMFSSSRARGPRMSWARFIASNTREIEYENHPTRIYLNRTQARSWTYCSSGRATSF